MTSFIPSTTALLLIDVQNFVLDKNKHAPRPAFYERVEMQCLPAIRTLQSYSRKAGIEVMFTVMENLTTDGRDRSLDYKLSGFNIPKGSSGATIPATFNPIGDEIIFRKTSACVFHSTNIEYVLRNIGISTIICAGFLTDQCIEQTMCVGCSLGFNMICISNAVASNTNTRHQSALNRIAHYGNIIHSDQLSNFEQVQIV